MKIAKEYPEGEVLVLTVKFDLAGYDNTIPIARVFREDDEVYSKVSAKSLEEISKWSDEDYRIFGTEAVEDYIASEEQKAQIRATMARLNETQPA